MLLKHNGLGLHGVACPDGSMVVLKPGVNELPQAQWEAIKSHPTIKEHVEEGKLEVVSEEAGAPAEQVLSKLSKKEALKLVEETIDLALIEKWLDAEKRADVMKALKARMDVLTAPPVYRDDKKGA